MKIAEDIQILKTDCYVGDLVQYKNKLCMIIEIESGANKWDNFGLLCLEEGMETGKVIASGLTLWDVQVSIQGVLVKQSDVFISKLKEKVK